MAKKIKLPKTLILGGGTFSPIRNHFSLAAPAFGTTARKLHELLPGSTLVLTKMADYDSDIITNEDVEVLIQNALKDKNLKGIILNVAFCDYAPSAVLVGNERKEISGFGLKEDRLKTKDGNVTIIASPAEKIISKIRKQRPDIFLVGFKTTTNAEETEQFLTALKMMKSAKCNLVMANDTVTGLNMTITAEESIYGKTTNRNKALKELVDIYQMRINGTYTKSEFIGGPSHSIMQCSGTFREVVNWLINNGGFIENNGNGFTPGHFCQKISNNSFLSSQRKADHRKVFLEGMSLVTAKWNHLDLSDPEYFTEDEQTFVVQGGRKASVGARSQWMILRENPGYDCIIHTHNPLKKGSKIPVTSQKPYQCGSLECGINTVSNLKEFDGIKAVYLDKHGANILFKSSEDSSKIIKFIIDNIELGIKTT